MNPSAIHSASTQPLDRNIWTERFVHHLVKKQVRVDSRLLRLVADDMWKYGRHAEPHVMAQSLVDAR